MWLCKQLGVRSDSLLEMMDNRTLLMDDLCRIDSIVLL